MPAKTGLISVMERAARKAGIRLRRDFSEVEQLQTSKKGARDFTTKAHLKAERTIYDELLHARPDWSFLMEEGGEIAGDPLCARWIIDPLDGGQNFMHAIPHFAISIAVQERRLDGKGWGDIVACLIYQPLTDESFWAEKTRGAWLGERRLRVSGRKNLSDALLAIGTPYDGGNVNDDTPENSKVNADSNADKSELSSADNSYENWYKIYNIFSPKVAGIRRLGSASLDMAWLAAGRYDGYWEQSLQPWSTAAGCLLVREAGGFVTDFKGRSPVICDQEILAASDMLHSRFHKLLVGALR